MTWKLALINVKKRWQDYTVLMLGLVISVAIFYMFQTLSLNTAFLKEAIPTVSLVGFIFQLGSVMLGIITVVYIFYANSFLLSMRKKEYGMYMMFGAKKRKIKQMMTIETLFIGGLALIIGMLVGTVFAEVMSHVLMTTLELESDTYAAFSVNASLVTIIFFAVLFIFTALMNNHTFSKTKLLGLLKEEETSEKFQVNKLKSGLMTLVAVVLLAVGYWSLANLNVMAQVALVVGMLTITFGTFAFYQALFPVVLAGLKKANFAQKNLRLFTLSQLSFKASAISRVLGMVTMMLSLSLGAITVGFAFENQIDRITGQFPYDVISINPTAEIKAEIEQLSIKEKRVLQMKQVENVKYFVYDELKSQPLVMEKTEDRAFNLGQTTEKTVLNDFEVNTIFSYDQSPSNVMWAFSELDNPYATEMSNVQQIKIVDQAQFDQIKAPLLVNYSVVLNDFKADLPILKKIDALETQRLDQKDVQNMSKYQNYKLVSGMMSGFMFMGAFLGIAFLAMLASCLMFKILSGAHADRKRYDMLHKMGVRKSLLLRSIAQEIGVLFVVPALLGTVHVLFGLKMFELLLADPYGYLLVPFAMFAVVYFIYYLFTVILYKNIVLKKSEA